MRGVVLARRNTGMGFRECRIRLRNGRVVYLCQNAVCGFKFPDPNRRRTSA
jgi:hypothetical protein